MSSILNIKRGTSSHQLATAQVLCFFSLVLCFIMCFRAHPSPRRNSLDIFIPTDYLHMAEFTHSTRLNIYDFQHPSHAVRLHNSHAFCSVPNQQLSVPLQWLATTLKDISRQCPLSLPSLLAFATQRVEIVPEWQSRLLHASTSLSTLFITIASFFTSLDRSLSPSPCPIEQYTTPQTRPALDSAPPRRAGATTDMDIPVVLAIFVGLACSFIQSLGRPSKFLD